jgi:regulator of nonsense transcripts 2
LIANFVQECLSNGEAKLHFNFIFHNFILIMVLIDCSIIIELYCSCFNRKAKPATPTNTAISNNNNLNEANSANNSAAAATTPIASESKSTPVAELSDADLKSFKQKMNEDSSALKERQAIREINVKFISPAQPRVELSKKLDSSIKKCQAYINKIKTIANQPEAAMISELETINLSKYLTELPAVLSETKLTKPADLTKFVKIASIMHKRHNYPEFIEPLIANLMKAFGDLKQRRKIMQNALGNSNNANNTALREILDEENNKEISSRKRSSLRFITELYFYGLLNDVKPIQAILFDFMQLDRLDVDTAEAQYTNQALLLSWLKYSGEEFIGIIPKNKKLLLERLNLSSPSYNSVSSSEQNNFKTMFKQYFQLITQKFEELHKQTRVKEKKNAKSLLTRGEISEENKKIATKLRDSLDRLYNNLVLFAELLDFELIQPPEPAEEVDSEEILLSLVSLDSATDGILGPEASDGFDDEEQRDFYRNLVDLKLIVPPILLGEGNQREKNKIMREKLAEDRPSNEESTEISEKKPISAQSPENEDNPDKWSIEDLESKVKQFASSGFNPYKAKKSGENQQSSGNNETEEDWEDEEYENYMREAEEAKNSPIEQFISGLTTCFTKETIDQAAAKFCYLNNKANRLRLADALGHIQRRNPDLVPYLSRFVAILSPFMAEIGENLVERLQAEFFRLLRRKDQANNSNRLQQKLNNMKYLCELTKFSVCSSTILFRCWRSLLLQSNLNPHNLQTMSILTENCGRFLYFNPLTHLRCLHCLQLIEQIKQNQIHDRNLVEILDSAVKNCKPRPVIVRQSVKQRSLIEEYCRNLIFKQLSSKTIESTLQKLRKFDWNKPEIRLLVVKSLCSCCSVSFANLNSLASLAAGVDRYQHIGPYVVDAVLEEIRFGLEANNYNQNQRRITTYRYLGALYSYKLFDSQVIFDQLYLLLTFGYSFNATTGNVHSALDPPLDSFRIRLVCTLLESVGHYFTHGLVAKRLDKFLLYFQRYLFLKNLIPIDVEFMLNDIFDRIRPKMVKFKSFQEANEAVEKLESGAKLSGKDFMVPINKQSNFLANSSQNDEENEEEEEIGEEGEELEQNSADTAAAAASPINSSLSGSSTQPLTAPAVNEELYDENSEGESGPEGEEEGEEEEEEEDDYSGYSRRGGSAAKFSAEDAEFDRELERMMNDSMEQRKFINPQQTIAPARVLLNSAGLTESKAGEKLTFVDCKSAEDEETEEKALVFKFLQRNPKKAMQSAARNLLIPAELSISQSTIQSMHAQQAEAQAMKEAVLRGLKTQEKAEQAAELGINPAVQQQQQQQQQGQQQTGRKPGGGGSSNRGGLSMKNLHNFTSNIAVNPNIRSKR